jgi:hypothetical protein
VRNEGSVPKGRLTDHTLSAVPSGLTAFYGPPPNVETLGYCRTSLRDEDQILVALDIPVRSEVVHAKLIGNPDNARVHIVLRTGMSALRPR